jgi:hypothetical protein
VDVTIKVWHLLLVLVGLAMVMAFMAGRYVAPVGKTETKTKAVYIHVKADRVDALQERTTAQADVRSVVPAMEAYYADHTTGYAGVTMTKLRESYDSGVDADGNTKIVRADSAGYCIESTAGSATYHKVGPSRVILAGPCP